jgi:hypothetical protein
VFSWAGTSLAQSPPAAPLTIALGDWQLSPLVDLRARGEYQHAPVDVGGNGTGVVNDTYVALERARLGLGAEHGPLRIQLTLQDAYAWGALTPSETIATGAPTYGVGAYEAYVEVRTSGARPSFVRIGRQAVTWGEGRLVSSADWSPAGRSLDAIRGRLSLGAWDFELLGALLEPRAPLGVEFNETDGVSSGGAELCGAQAAWAIDPLLKVELTALARIVQGANPPATATSRFDLSRASGETYVGSLRVFGEGRGWRYGAEGAYELGRATSLNDDPRGAYAAAAHVARTFDTIRLSPTVRVGGSFASGDDGNRTYKQFDPLLPDVHTWYGAMDVFAWSNEMEASARVTVVPWTDTAVAVEYRYAELVEPSGDWLNGYLGVVGQAPGNASRALGHEIDGFVTWRPWPALDLLAGYSAFILGEGAKAVLTNPAVGRGTVEADGSLKAASVAHFAYAQATVRVP